MRLRPAKPWFRLAPVDAGTVAGPSSGTSTDNALARWDGTTGLLLQNSPVVLSDSPNAVLSPASNDDVALGSGTLMWSDLFLASGAVIDFNNGDVTITHGANLLTIAGGSVTFSSSATFSAGLTATGQIVTAGNLTVDAITVPVEGMYRPTGAGNLGFSVSSAAELLLTATAFSPAVSDGNALGTGSLMWGDLFLADGAVINFNNGNVTLTHSAGILTLAGTLALGANSITMTGSLAATGARVTKGWFTDLEVTNSPTIGGTAISTTYAPLASPTFTGTVTLPTVTANGVITLAENASLGLDPAGSADGKWTGITITATAGYTQTFGDLVYLDPTDSRWELTDANSAAAADGDSRGIIGIVVVTGTDGNACTILLDGVIRADAKFPTFTVNNPIYISETAGAVTQTQPVTTDAVIRVVGFALTTDEMRFSPSRDYITHT